MYYAKHRDEAIEYSRVYHTTHRNEAIEYSRAYRASHPGRSVAEVAYDRNYALTHRDQRRAYDLAHQEHRREYQHEYFVQHCKDHKEQKRDYIRQYYAANKDRLSKKYHKYYAEHREDIIAYVTDWCRKHPELRRAQDRRRAALERGATVSKLTAAEWQSILSEFNHCCAYCGRSDLKLTQDHMIPLSRGGQHVADNIVPACTSCNPSKSDKTPLEYIAWLNKRSAL